MSSRPDADRLVERSIQRYRRARRRYARSHPEIFNRIEQARLRTIYETTSQLMGFLEVDGTVIAANRAALNAIGVSLEQVEGTKFWETPWFSETPGMPETVRHAVETAAKTVRDLRVAEVLRQDVTIGDGGVVNFRVRLAISFKYESGD